MSDLCTIYRIVGEKCQVLVDGERVILDVWARWVQHGQDSIKAREQIQAQLSELLNVTKWSRNVIFSVNGVAPKFIAGESSYGTSKPLPTVRAKVVMTFKYASQSDVDECFAIQERLENVLDESDIGFVDGNDIGGGEFRILCLGPRKAPLQEFVLDFMGRETMKPSSIK